MLLKVLCQNTMIQRKKTNYYEYIMCVNLIESLFLLHYLEEEDNATDYGYELRAMVVKSILNSQYLKLESYIFFL